MNACRRRPYVSRLSRARRFAVMPDQAGFYLKAVTRRQRAGQGIIDDRHGRRAAPNGCPCRDPQSPACIRAEHYRLAHAVHPGVQSGRGRILDAVESPCNGVAGTGDAASSCHHEVWSSLSKLKAQPKNPAPPPRVGQGQLRMQSDRTTQGPAPEVPSKEVAGSLRRPAEHVTCNTPAGLQSHASSGFFLV